MIVVTGAAGFIGSCLIARLNEEGFVDIVAVDEFGSEEKLKNLSLKHLNGVVHRNNFLTWLEKNHRRVDHIFHLGARTDTVEKDVSIFDALNLHYSQAVWRSASAFQIPLTYASSAATYGDGTLGYEDSHEVIKDLNPLNPYGCSKNDFDKWVLKRQDAPPSWVGLKFFNVYGPNEYHKDRMASVIFHTFRQIRDCGSMRLFRSHREGIADGHQSRDFIFIEDILNICLFCLQQRPQSGIYNAGSGKARSFLDLATATFKAMALEPAIQFIDTPIDIRHTYQYFTEANMTKLKSQGYTKPFHSLEDGISKYVKNYLIPDSYY